jgi:nucleoside-diphosphate-sugar epimerase
MKPQTIAVIGANGFIGSRLVAEALLNNVRVIALARKRRKHTPEKRVLDELEDNLTPEQITSFREKLVIFDYDLNEPQIGVSDSSLKTILDECGHIFNCVGDTTFFPRDREQLFATNIDGPAHIVETLCKSGAVFHHVSTAYVAGDRDGVIYESDLNVGQHFKNPYEESKCLGEKKVQEVCAQRGVRYNIYRPSIVIRDHAIADKPPHLNHFYLFFALLDSLYHEVQKHAPVLEDGYYHVPVRFFGSKDSTLNIVDLDFVTQALFYIGLHAPDSNKTYHLTNPQPVKNLRLLEIIMELYKIKGFTGVENPEDFTELNVYEKMLQEWFANYLDYFFINQDFNMTNTQAVLQGSGIQHPEFNKEYISRASGRV